MAKIKKPDSSHIFQLIWGCALFLMGAAFFFRIPEIIRDFSDYEHFFGTWYVELSMYLVSIMLIGGGAKKLYNIFYRLDDAAGSYPDESGSSSKNLDSGPD